MFEPALQAYLLSDSPVFSMCYSAHTIIILIIIIILPMCVFFVFFMLYSVYDFNNNNNNNNNNNSLSLLLCTVYSCPPPSSQFPNKYAGWTLTEQHSVQSMSRAGGLNTTNGRRPPSLDHPCSLRRQHAHTCRCQDAGSYRNCIACSRSID